MWRMRRILVDTQKKNKVSTILNFIKLHILLLFYALSSCCSKAAAKYEFLSFKFILLYGAVVFILLVYAVLWQQILKKMPLFIAYANKSIVVIWGMIFGYFLFQEKLNIYSIIGAVIIIIGVLLVIKKDE